MKYFTYQRKDKQLDLEPDFTNGRTLCNKEAYLYILDLFNKFNNTNYSGLVFGYVANSVSEVLNRIKRNGIPYGSWFPSKTHSLWEVEVPDEIPILQIDFYRFSDLIFCYEENKDDTLDLFNLFNLTLEEAKRDLLKPNGKDWELPVVNIPYIKKEWVNVIHFPKDFY